jgi:hypothetical protein
MTTSSPTAPAARPASLTAADRCDRCGARARVSVRLPAGELLFCGHHSAQHAQALAAAVGRAVSAG